MFNNSPKEYSADPNAKYGYNAEYLQAVDDKFKITYLGHSSLDPVVIKMNSNSQEANSNKNFLNPTNMNKLNSSPNRMYVKNNGGTSNSSSRIPMDLADVSSDEADSDDSEHLRGNESEGKRRQYNYEKRIKSINKAKAALPADFQNRIGSGHISSRILKSRENVQIFDEDEDNRKESDNESDGSSHNELEESDEISEDSSDEKPANFRPHKGSGVKWAEESLSLIEIINELREKRTGGSHLIKSVCQRQNCKCAFRGHETLLMFTLLDSYLANSTWEKPSSHRVSSKQFVTHRTNVHSTADNKKSEVEADLMIFRQCRGWYEVLNEDGVAIPFYSNLEQIQRNAKMTFLARKDTKVLLPPSSVSYVPMETQPIPNSYITAAQSAECIDNSTPFVMKSGTLFLFVKLLQNCSFKRGRRVKTMNLLLAIERHTPGKSDSQRTSSKVGENSETKQKRLFYIGIEEASKEAYFPSSLCVSTVAGPENISGVHSMAGILKKFRLPISIRPVGVSDCTNVSNENSQSLSKEVEFPLMHGLTYTEKHILKLRSIYRGDLLIIAAADNPERFYIITPSMLKDHLFHLGYSEDKKYNDLLKNHCSKIASFLAVAHTKDALEYLLKFMTDTTHLPRIPARPGLNQHMEFLDGYTHDEAMKIASMTGKDPRIGNNSNMKPEEVTQLFEEIDDIYFYIRNGYYPKKSRLRVRSRISDYGPVGTGQPLARKISTNNRMSPVNLHSNQTQRMLPSSDQLLAASLNIDSDV